MNDERNMKYDTLVLQEKQARESGNDVLLEEYYSQAVKMYPNRENAYIEKIYMMYEQQRYSDVIDFVEGIVLNSSCEQNSLLETYHIYGNCLLENGEQGLAMEAIQFAVNNGLNTSDGYLDYAIISARNGDVSNAERVLNIAVEMGLGQDNIYYVQGEIAQAKGKVDLAVEYFLKSISETQNDYMKMRAYVVIDRINRGKLKDNDALTKNISLLEQAVIALPDRYRNPVLEGLAQSYMDLSDKSNDEQAYKYDDEKNILNQMMEIYGERYDTYKLLAFMELYSQNQNDNADRDYNQFEFYYTKSMELYNKQLKNNKTDMDMQLLEELDLQLQQGGWIEN